MMNPYAAQRILKAFDMLREEIAKALTPPDPMFTSDVWMSDYDTVLGYLSKVAPDYLHDLEDPLGYTVRDGFWCSHRCRERGIPVIKVLAPPVLRNKGVEWVNAYPVDILKERLGGEHV